MKISKRTQYAIRAMVYLAKVFPEKRVSPIKEISEKEGISFDFLEKIMADLEKSGLVKAKKGTKGGYFLSKGPEKIKASEIMEALEEDIAPVGCMGCPKAGACSSQGLWNEVEDSLDSTLNSITLADLIE